MTRVVAAIYRPDSESGWSNDDYFHASMSCNYKWNGHASLSPSTTRITDQYRVMQVWDVIQLGKTPCPECWVLTGYHAEDDVVAAL